MNRHFMHGLVDELGKAASHPYGDPFAPPGSHGAYLYEKYRAGEEPKPAVTAPPKARFTGPRKSLLTKKAVWTAPGQKSLSESLPGKISPNVFDQFLDRVIGSRSVKTRLGFAKMLKQTRREEGPKAGRDVLAIARAHAKGLPGVEGHLGQRVIERAKPSTQSGAVSFLRQSPLMRRIQIAISKKRSQT